MHELDSTGVFLKGLGCLCIVEFSFYSSSCDSVAKFRKCLAMNVTEWPDALVQEVQLTILSLLCKLKLKKLVSRTVDVHCLQIQRFSNYPKEKFCIKLQNIPNI